jgi:hypothetical protein
MQRKATPAWKFTAPLIVVPSPGKGLAVPKWTATRLMHAAYYTANCADGAKIQTSRRFWGPLDRI